MHEHSVPLGPYVLQQLACDAISEQLDRQAPKQLLREKGDDRGGGTRLIGTSVVHVQAVLAHMHER